MKDDPRSKEGGTIVGSYSLLSFFHFEVGVYLCLFFRCNFFVCCRKVLMLLS